MSNILSKIGIRTAKNKKNKLDLSRDHITTSDFFQICPTFIQELVPGQSINVKAATFTRLSPLVNPMYGRCRIVNRAFFVPYRTIMDGWNEFITDTPYRGQIISQPITLRYQDIISVFIQTPGHYTTVVTQTPGITVPYDFSIFQGTSLKYYNFTDKGRKIWKILQSLGYKFEPRYYWNQSSSTTIGKVSALPLLSFLKIYSDWYQNQAYRNDLMDKITNSGVLTIANLDDLFSLVSDAQYDKDYFTSAWDNPNSPNAQKYSGVEITDPTLTLNNNPYAWGTDYNPVVTNKYNDFVVQSHDSSLSLDVTGTTELGDSVTGTAEGSATVSNSTSITPNGAPYLGMGTQGISSAGVTSWFGIKALRSLTDYMKRHQLAGALAMDRMMARFGSKPSDAALRRSVYIGKQTADIQISDVMATASGETTGTAASSTAAAKSKLGDYAGKGVGYGDGSFKYETNEYGVLIIVSVVMPKIGYVQGESRFVNHLDRLSFFTPEFDNLGVQAIAKKELKALYHDAEYAATTNNLDGVFGFTSRYAEYKTAFDNLTGDFAVPSRNKTLNSWHLFRLIGGDDSGNPPQHNAAFCTGNQSQFDRIFAYTDSNYDHFINIHHFEVTTYAPMSKLFDDYEFEEDDHNEGRPVSIDINGTQLN